MGESFGGFWWLSYGDGVSMCDKGCRVKCIKIFLSLSSNIDPPEDKVRWSRIFIQYKYNVYKHRTFGWWGCGWLGSEKNGGITM